MDKSEYEYDSFAEHHKMQLVMSGVPSHFWPVLHQKLKKETFDAGDHFSMIFQHDEDESVNSERYADLDNGVCESSDSCATVEQTGGFKEKFRNVSFAGSITGSGCQRSRWKVIVCDPEGVSKSDPAKIFLIDHAWTFKPHDVRKHLLHIPGLLSRMKALVDLGDSLERDDTVESVVSSEHVDQVLDRLWMYSQTYTVNKDDLTLEEKLSVWYVMDEFGSRIRHHDEPKFRIIPFYYVPQQMLYSLLFPIANADYGDEVTRDFVEGTTYHRSDWRDLYLLPWFPRSFSIPVRFHLPDDDYFQTYEPVTVDVGKSQEIPTCTDDKVLKVYAEDDQIVKHLNHPLFASTSSMDEADIWWLQTHFKDFKYLLSEKPKVMLNQFPCESVLTVKDLLAACVHTVYEDREMNEKTMEFPPAWFCTTFNLRTELPEFVSYFQKRDVNDLDNTWILKPWNLARSLDTFVTNDLKQIIRMIDSGPKLACKYIEDPVLFYRSDVDAWVKFDMRFIVFLRSVHPLQVYVFDRFWPRFAAKSFSLDNFDDFEKHFTVFNYADKDKILQMYCDEFVSKFSKQYPDQKWADVQSSIYETIKATFSVATALPPPKGLVPLRQCRAMYGVDVMLKWAQDDGTLGEKYVQPVVLEVNYMPDCLRACDYYPEFANTVFLTLFSTEPHKYDLPIKQL